MPLRYSTTSELAITVFRKCGLYPEYGQLETLKKGDKVYVRPCTDDNVTNEVIRSVCAKHGYVYSDRRSIQQRGNASRDRSSQHTIELTAERKAILTLLPGKSWQQKIYHLIDQKGTNP